MLIKFIISIILKNYNYNYNEDDINKIYLNFIKNNDLNNISISYIRKWILLNEINFLTYNIEKFNL